jgi:hypothetical protein
MKKLLQQTVYNNKKKSTIIMPKRCVLFVDVKRGLELKRFLKPVGHMTEGCVLVQAFRTC